MLCAGFAGLTGSDGGRGKPSLAKSVTKKVLALLNASGAAKPSVGVVSQRAPEVGLTATLMPSSATTRPSAPEPAGLTVSAASSLPRLPAPVDGLASIAVSQA